MGPELKSEDNFAPSLKMTRGQRIQEPSQNGPFAGMSSAQINQQYTSFFRNGPGSLVTGNC